MDKKALKLYIENLINRGSSQRNLIQTSYDGLYCSEEKE